MRHPPIHPSLGSILHGGDYNPDQWLDRPDVLEADTRLMRLAGVNVATVGVFAWATLEPEEGVYRFDWLDETFDRLHRAGVRIVLATPTGAKPAWMSHKYPEIRRCGPDGRREPHGFRHNHCWTSPIYRARAREINSRLAERYGNHPALVLWHLSNEYGGYCHCPLCMEAFQGWLRRRYETLDALDKAWWTRFWSHTFTDWRQIDFIDPTIPAMVVDWKRFTTDQCVDFMLAEIEPLRRITPDIPLTHNMMATYEPLDYWRLAPHLDRVSWDAYPSWHSEPEHRTAAHTAFHCDMYRAMKGGRPWILMESTPSRVNWQKVCRSKKPGMHRLASLQAVAHGSDAVMYFQWRAGRGGAEKYHGAVVDHNAHEHTRVFRDVAQVGADLKRLERVIGTSTAADVAVVYDWECRWAYEAAQGFRADPNDYPATVIGFYRALWKRGVSVDVINADQDFSRYRMVVAPMLYMLRPGLAERIDRFVEEGGVFVGSYLSGLVDENDLCFQGGFPGPLRQTLGVVAEEIDILYDHDRQSVSAQPDNPLGLEGSFAATRYCELIRPEGAQVVGSYDADFYAGTPALTVNRRGRGEAWYLGARLEERFQDEMLGRLAGRLGVRRAVDADLPEGVSAAVRTDGERSYLFLMNFTPHPQRVRTAPGTVLLGNAPTDGDLELLPWGAAVVEQAR